MESSPHMSQQKLLVEEALLASADFLSSCLPLANTHPVDFIVQDAWNKILPANIESQLLALTEQQLLQLPSGDIFCPDLCHPVQPSIEATLSSCNEGEKEMKTALETGVHSKHVSLKGLMTEVREHCLDQLLCLTTSMDNLISWLKERDGHEFQRSTPFVHAFMNQKKMHEVEIMADLCAEIFDRSSANAVIDVGSGKGYLSTHLSLQCHLPVIGIDSQPHNTSGAVQRAVKLQRQWNSLVKNEQKKGPEKENHPLQVQDIQREMTEKCSMSKDCSDDIATEQDVASCNDNNDVCDCDNKTSLRVRADKECHLQKKSKSQTDLSKVMKTVSKPNLESKLCVQNQKIMSESTHTPDRTLPHRPMFPQRKETTHETENQTNQSKSALTHVADDVNETDNQTSPSKAMSNNFAECAYEAENQTSQSKASSNNVAEGANETENPTNLTKAPGCKSVALTVYIDSDTNLTELVKEPLGTLCPDKPATQVRLLLTGLHTCGPLASSMLRLFVNDQAVRAMCGVGCCYQLMQERFVDDTARDWQEPHHCPESALCEGPPQPTGDFPLSSVLLERRMSLGCTALNIASLALPRMAQSSGELQGKTYYPRALLQAFIHKKLGHIPPRLAKLRKLAKQARDPPDYIRRALLKLNISGCEATEEEIRQFHEQHCHMERKMTAFFQLRAALAPVVETVVLLDRLLCLLEQDCVEKAFLVRLFNPVTSPRCHAIIAVKKEQLGQHPGLS